MRWYAHTERRTDVYGTKTSLFLIPRRWHADNHGFLKAFYRAADWMQGGLVARKVSVRPSVCRSNAWSDSTEEKSVQIFIPYEKPLRLVFWENEWLVGGRPILQCWNLHYTCPHAEPASRTEQAITDGEMVTHNMSEHSSVDSFIFYPFISRFFFLRVFFLLVFVLVVFTALHGMQTRSMRWEFCLSVCPSVCHTRGLWRNGRKICPDLYTIRKNI